MKYPETESEICAGVVPRSRAICGKAGRYMSMEKGLTVLSAPRMRMISRFERELRGICKLQLRDIRRRQAPGDHSSADALRGGAKRRRKRGRSYARQFPATAL